MEGLWIALIVFVVIFIIAFFAMLNKGGKILSNLKYDAWNKIGEHLGEEFVITSKIIVNSTEYHKESNSYIPDMVISIDSKNKRFAFSRIASEEKDEKGVIRKYLLASDFIDFKSIVGGNIVLGGRSSKTIGSSVGGVNNGMVGSIGTASTSNYVNFLHYSILLDSIDMPTYTVHFFDRSVDEESVAFKRYVTNANDFDAIIKKIIETNKQA